MSLTARDIALRLGLARLLAGATDDVDVAFAPARAIDPLMRITKAPEIVTVEQRSALGAGSRYEADLQIGKAFRTELPPLYTLGPDRLGDATVDFTQFKKWIYDYGGALHLVRSFVEESGGSPKPDLIYVADLPTLPVGILLKRHFGAKLLLDCHEWWREQEKIWNPHARERIKVIDGWERRLYPECDWCITVGEELATAMSDDLAVPFESIYTCVFETPPERMSDIQRAVFREQRLGVPADTKVALFQGSLTEKRNLEALVRATRHLREDQRLVIAGDGPFAEQLKTILRSEGSPDRTVLAGWVEQYDLMNFTLAADIGVLPYIAHSPYYALSMPNKLAEYHACRLPIIGSSDLVEVTRIITSDKVGTSIPMDDPDLLGPALAQILDDKDRIERWRSNYTTDNEKFTYVALRRSTEELVQRLLEPASTPISTRRLY